MLWVSRSLGFYKSNLYILKVESDKPRHVRVRISPVSSPLVEQKLLSELHFSPNRPPPVHHHGSLHRYSYGAIHVVGANIVFIVFDIEAVSFPWMHGPT